MTSKNLRSRKMARYSVVLTFSTLLNLIAPSQSRAQIGAQAPLESRVTGANGHDMKSTLATLSNASLELLKATSGRADRTGRPAPAAPSQGNAPSSTGGRRDSLWNGTLIGAAVGGVSGALVGAANCANYSCQAGPVALAFGAGFAGIGAAAGALIDWAIK
jgi:hypothetical protein